MVETLKSTLPSAESPLPSWWGSQTRPPDGRLRWHNFRTPTGRNFWSESRQSKPTSDWHVLKKSKGGDVLNVIMVTNGQWWWLIHAKTTEIEATGPKVSWNPSLQMFWLSVNFKETFSLFVVYLGSNEQWLHKNTERSCGITAKNEQSCNYSPRSSSVGH